MDFMNDLVSRGWVQSSKYLTSVQSGTEIFTGTGELDTTGYYCRIQ
jgi:xyloglucan-specific endo-beta-1,4-glucanase